MQIRCRSVVSPRFLRTKGGAKSVGERRNIEFGTEEERRINGLSTICAPFRYFFKTGICVF